MKPIEKSQNVENAGIVHRAIKGVVDAYELTLAALASENEQHRVTLAVKDAEIERLRAKLQDAVKEVQENRAQADVLVGEALEALIWCSGSPSFAPEGDAHEGWKKLGRATIEKLQAWQTAKR